MPETKTIVVGKRANLSRAITEKISNCSLVASSNIESLPLLLKGNQSSNIIYNSFVKSSQLYRKDQPIEYANHTINLLSKFTKYCLENSKYINSVILTSSSSVYGDNDFATEEDVCRVGSLYASAKLTSEFFLSEHFKDTSIKLIIPRIFNMYGGHDEFSIVAKIEKAIKNDTTLTITNNGSAIRDFIHIKDVVDIYLKLLQSEAHGVINVGTGKGISVYEIIQAAELAYGKKLKTSNKKINEIRKSTANIEKLKHHIEDYNFIDIYSYYKSCQH